MHFFAPISKIIEGEIQAEIHCVDLKFFLVINISI